MGLYIKGNPQPGEYKLIKTTDGWVLEGKHIAYDSIVLDLEHDEDLIEFMNRFNVYYQTKRIITEMAENLGINIEDDFGKKEGEWIEDEDGEIVCSKCDYPAEFNPISSTFIKTNYCPNCGAIMKRGER